MTLEVRAYNVLFGDCALISWDEDDGKHHAWVDFGNHPGDNNSSFQPVYDDVLRRTDGHLDLVVITHRHMDHLEGFFSLRTQFQRDFHIDRLWHAHVDDDLDKVFSIAGDDVRQLHSDAALSGLTPMAITYQNNFGSPLAAGLTTKDRMDAILAELPADSDHEVHRGLSLDDAHIERMSVDVLAPEEDSMIYLQDPPHALAAAKDAVIAPPADRAEIFPWPGKPATESDLIELDDFSRLRRRLRALGDDILAAVDKTRNNTSVVTRWRYEGVTLLLTGDAEERSWEVMREKGVDLRADLIKVPHHGSINGAPDWAYQQVFPGEVPHPRNRVLVSTDPTRYRGVNEVPKAEVLARWRERVTRSSRLKRTDESNNTSEAKFVGFRYRVGP